MYPVPGTIYTYGIIRVYECTSVPVHKSTGTRYECTVYTGTGTRYEYEYRVYDIYEYCTCIGLVITCIRYLYPVPPYTRTPGTGVPEYRSTVPVRVHKSTRFITGTVYTLQPPEYTFFFVPANSTFKYIYCIQYTKVGGYPVHDVL